MQQIMHLMWFESFAEKIKHGAINFKERLSEWLGRVENIPTHAESKKRA
jgi:hypothetical protein